MNVINVEGSTHALLITIKAFGSIDQNLLIKKHVEIRLHGNSLRILQSVNKCKIKQVLDKETDRKKWSKKLVLIKRTNYHIYFITFFNADRYCELKRNELEVIFYADDLVLSGSSRSFLQQCLNQLEENWSGNYFNVNTLRQHELRSHEERKPVRLQILLKKIRLLYKMISIFSPQY